MSARGHSATWQQVPATSALPPQSRQALTRLARQFRANSDIADLIRSPCRRVPAMPLEPSHPLPPNLLSPLRLDAMSEQWPVQQADALVCINTIHITPWEACKGLMTGAERILRSGGVLYLYGPYQIDGRHTAQSNEEYDAWLRTQTLNGAYETSPRSRLWRYCCRVFSPQSTAGSPKGSTRSI